jgi:hypothetical protein
VHEKGVVTITSSSGSLEVKNVADPTASYFHSHDRPRQSIHWDFHDMRVRISHYLISGSSLRAWCLEGSTNNTDWIEIDLRSHGTDQDLQNGSQIFRVSRTIECRFFRLTQLAENIRHNHVLDLSVFDIFGILLYGERVNIGERIDKHDQDLKEIDSRLSRIDSTLSSLPAASRAILPADGGRPAEPVSVNLPMKNMYSLDGIISYLTNRHGGNVHTRRIVTVTTNAADPKAPRHMVDRTRTANVSLEGGQWICWDFGERRVQLTTYTINATDFRSWTLDISIDGNNWTKVDERPGEGDFNEANLASFASWTNATISECRFIRITAIGGRKLIGKTLLILNQVEFFGVLLCE